MATAVKSSSPKALTVADLSDIFQELINIQADWYNFGLMLSVPDSVLQSIKKDYPSSSMDCLREVIKYFLRNIPDPTWETIVQALISRTVGHANLAKQLEERKCCEVEHQLSVRELQQQFEKMAIKHEEEVEKGSERDRRLKRLEVSSQKQEKSSREMKFAVDQGKRDVDERFKKEESKGRERDGRLKKLEHVQSKGKSVGLETKQEHVGQQSRTKMEDMIHLSLPLKQKILKMVMRMISTHFQRKHIATLDDNLLETVLRNIDDLKKENVELRARLSTSRAEHVQQPTRTRELSREPTHNSCPRCSKLQDELFYLREKFEKALSKMKPVGECEQQEHDELGQEYRKLWSNEVYILRGLKGCFEEQSHAKIFLTKLFVSAYEKSRSCVWDRISDRVREIFRVHEGRNDYEMEHLDSTSHAYGLLVQSSMVKSDSVKIQEVQKIIDEIKAIYKINPPHGIKKGTSTDYLLSRLKLVVDLTWRFVTQPCPVIVCEPRTLDAKKCTKHQTHSDLGSCQSAYARPLVYRSFHGNVLSPGVVLENKRTT